MARRIADNPLGLGGNSEETFGLTERDQMILPAVLDEQRDMKVPYPEIRTKRVTHQYAYRDYG